MVRGERVRIYCFRDGLLIILFGGFLSGCVIGAYSVTSIVAVKAAKDFGCNKNQVNASMNEDKTVSVVGCGKTAIYNCFHSGPWHEATVIKCKQHQD